MAFLSYFAAGLAYLFFAALLLAAKAKSNSGKLLLLVSLVAVAWALQVLVYYELDWGEISLFLVFDGLRSLSWLIFIVCLMQPEVRIRQQLFQSGSVWVSLLAWLLLVFCFYFDTYFAPAWSFYLNIFLAIQVMVKLERVYRHLTPEHRWRLKPLVLYLGVVFGFDFFFYAQAALFNQFDQDIWQVRGFVHCVCLPLLVLATRRTTHWTARIYVSREVVFHSSLLVLAGLYLLLMALFGYYIKYMGGEWGGAIQALFVVVAILMLAVVYFSQSFRQKVKVFIAKHFFANRYEYRDEWLSLTQDLMEQPKQQSPYQYALEIMLKRLSTDTGAIYQVQDNQVTLMAACQLSQPVAPEQLTGLMQYFSQSSWIIDVPEFRNSPQRYPGLVMPQGVMAMRQLWLVVPAFYQHRLVALIFIGQSRALTQLNWEDRDYIKVLAKQLAHYLVLHQAHRDLSEAKQFQAFNQMSAFLVHDLKNTLSQLSMIISNAEKHKRNPEFIDDSLATVANAVQRISRVVDHFRLNARQSAAATEVDLADLLQQACQRCSQEQPEPKLEVLASARTCVDQMQLLEVVQHLIKNAQDATEPEGEVRVRLSVEQGRALIAIQDTGCGMDEEFIRSRLFAPFDTTKGNAGMGIGVYEAKQFAMVNKGQLNVVSELGVGSCFTLTLPIYANCQEQARHKEAE
ncbi:XrtA/PEP-CTERM system histidine kinase PrsK [Motilimonas sp. KMU-193]|uniref:XrtA/PEP-CTERM system histidine kinase PrsK n=1 Tax=Motilimonas sp. KMU-193 TaxID=3388668 RepID=UPI00396B1272